MKPAQKPAATTTIETLLARVEALERRLAIVENVGPVKLHILGVRELEERAAQRERARVEREGAAPARRERFAEFARAKLACHPSLSVVEREVYNGYKLWASSQSIPEVETMDDAELCEALSEMGIASGIVLNRIGRQQEGFSGVAVVPDGATVADYLRTIAGESEARQAERREEDERYRRKAALQNEMNQRFADRDAANKVLASQLR